MALEEGTVHFSAKLFLVFVGLSLIFDLWAHFSRHVPTLTRSIVQYIPAEITLTFLLWLFLHFLWFYTREQ